MLFIRRQRVKTDPKTDFFAGDISQVTLITTADIVLEISHVTAE